MTAVTELPLQSARENREYWGRLVESAAGAHLINAASAGSCQVYYWRARNLEVDFGVRSRGRLAAIEVKSGKVRRAMPGSAASPDAFGPARKLLVGGGDGISLEDFLSEPVERWL